MLTAAAITHFGSKRKLAAAVGVKAPTVYGWGDLVPEKHAYRLEKLTDGALKYNPAVYPRTTDAA
ncbi:Cro/CI family transcriptional regulator [Symbiopectobacterium purcellii]|uniref:Cro/CI family transcriptional regulator n=1 Tax=Symbiopectobacterium purcellii TaxID=2871826 RepID=UPI003F83D088